MKDFTEPSPEIMAKIQELNGWMFSRRESYEKLEEQLDMLYKDVKNGLFGDSAKSGQWFSHIDNIKSSNPKPTEEQISIMQEELETLIKNE